MQEPTLPAESNEANALHNDTNHTDIAQPTEAQASVEVETVKEVSQFVILRWITLQTQTQSRALPLGTLRAFSKFLAVLTQNPGSSAEIMGSLGLVLSDGVVLKQPNIFEFLAKINKGQISQDDLFTKFKLKKEIMVDKNKRGGANGAQQNGRTKSGGAEDDLVLQDDEDILPFQKQPESLKGGILRDYQLEGVNWLKKLYFSGLNGILADEMGLGKTIQSIGIMALVWNHKVNVQKRQHFDPCLVLVPKVTLAKWAKEIRAWVPDMRLLVFYGDNQERETLKQAELKHGKYDIILTTFEIGIIEKNCLRKFNYEMLVLDEAHRIKNDQSKLSLILRTLSANFRLLLTGTPLQNKLKELWALLNFIMPKLFDSNEEFIDLFTVSDSQEEQYLVVEQIKRLLRPFILRRLKCDVERQMPGKKEIYLFLQLAEFQKKMYKDVLSKNVGIVNAGGDRSQLMNTLMQLRKVANHPYLFDNVEPGPPFINGPHLYSSAIKFQLLDGLLPKLHARGDKVLIFSQMTRLLDILDDYLRWRGYNLCRIDGKTSTLDRERMIDEFQEEDSDKFVFILSTRAGGLGIDLFKANVVIIFDQDWNPQVDLQAIGRAHRIGQKREVTVYRLVTEGTVEQVISIRAAKKLKVDHLLMRNGKLHGKDYVQNNELHNMITFNIQNYQNIDAQTIGDESCANFDIDQILEDSQKKTDELTSKIDSEIESKFNMTNFSITENDINGGQKDSAKDLYVFENEDYKKAKDDHGDDDNQMWGDGKTFFDIGPRAKNQASYDINKYYQQVLNPNTGKPGKEKKKLTGWKAIANGGYEHQFFDNKKLEALEAKEKKWNEWKEANGEKAKKGPPQFTKKDQDNRDNLLTVGFANWSKKDFYAYVRLMEKYGRFTFDKIASELRTKTEEEVKIYSEKFWKNVDSLEYGAKYVERIEKGEQQLKKLQKIENFINSLFKDVEDVEAMKVPKSIYKGGINDHEKKILQGMLKYGFNSWELILHDIKSHPKFRFDWKIKCMTVGDLEKKANSLLANIK